MAKYYNWRCPGCGVVFLVHNNFEPSHFPNGELSQYSKGYCMPSCALRVKNKLCVENIRRLING
jgi:hypothetical protein